MQEKAGPPTALARLSHRRNYPLWHFSPHPKYNRVFWPTPETLPPISMPYHAWSMTMAIAMRQKPTMKFVTPNSFSNVVPRVLIVGVFDYTLAVFYRSFSLCICDIFCFNASRLHSTLQYFTVCFTSHDFLIDLPQCLLPTSTVVFQCQWIGVLHYYQGLQLTVFCFNRFRVLTATLNARHWETFGTPRWQVEFLHTHGWRLRVVSSPISKGFFLASFCPPIGILPHNVS